MPVEAAGYFAYGLYDDCTYDAGLLRSSQPRSLQPRSSSSTAGLRARLAAFLPVDAAAALRGGATNDYVCGGGGAQRQWVGRPGEESRLSVATAHCPWPPGADSPGSGLRCALGTSR